MSLSSFLRAAADRAHDRRIPAAEQDFIRQVEAAERCMSADLGRVEQCWQNLRAALEEVTDANAVYRAARRHAALNPGDGEARARMNAAAEQFRQALEWEADKATDLRAALHQESEDRRNGAAA